MKVMVVDGQGGGVGRALAAALRARLPEGHTITAIGTNALATSAMLKAGAHEGATGEYAVIRNAPGSAVIAGPVGIVLAGAMLGELTPGMARAIAESDAMKVLIPMEKCQVHVVGFVPQPLADLISQAVDAILSILQEASR